jgi:L-asparaginase/Glu-tRNA(Gln) amidotransferase subunit D
MTPDVKDFRNPLMESGIKREGYTAPDWIEDSGRYLDDAGHFNPNAYDPSAQYDIQGSSYCLASNPEKKQENPFDLENLRFIDPKKIQNLLIKMEGLAAAIEDESSGKEVVAMIGTGGTIAMTMVDGKLQPTLDPDYLLKYAGGALDHNFSVASAEYPTPIDSSEQEIDYEADLVIAMSWMWKNMSDQLKKVFSGFLITHGTDTMGGGSTAVTMMLGPNAPFSVGFVGAQKTTEDQFSDVGSNVKGSFETLSTLKRRNKVGRFVFMGGTEGGAFHPAGVLKTDDRRVSAFRAPIHERLLDASDFGLHGIIDRFGRRYMETLERGGAKDDFSPIVLRGYSPIIDLNPKIGTDPERYYRQIMADEKAKAVLLTTFGSFTANSKVRKAITLAAERSGKIVLGANPFPGGSTEHSYAPAKALRDSGAYPVGTLPDATASKVFIGSAVYGDNRVELARFLTNTNIVGEQAPSEWMLKTKDGDTTQAPDTSDSKMPRFGAPDAFYERS